MTESVQPTPSTDVQPPSGRGAAFILGFVVGAALAAATFVAFLV